VTATVDLKEILSLVENKVQGPLRDCAIEGIKAGFEAGTFAGKRYGASHDISYKGEIDLVTETDIESERIIKERLEDVGEAEIMAEESSQDSSLRDGTFWIIDPLDGTTNFAHGFPFFAPSIAYCKIESGRFQPLFGCIFIPCLNELFWAVKGIGSYLNVSRITVSTENRLSRALLATGFPYDVHQNARDVLSAFQGMLIRAQGIRRAGAAAIDLAYVACGRFEGFWEMKLKPWDTAAGQLLVEEAEGMVTGFRGQGYDPFLPEIIASNKLIHGQMVDILKAYSKKR